MQDVEYIGKSVKYSNICQREVGVLCKRMFGLIFAPSANYASRLPPKRMFGLIFASSANYASR